METRQFKTKTGVVLQIIDGGKALKKTVSAVKAKTGTDDADTFFDTQGGIKYVNALGFDLPEGTKIIDVFKFRIPYVYHYEWVKEITPDEEKPTQHTYLQWFGGVYTSRVVSRW